MDPCISAIVESKLRSIIQGKIYAILGLVTGAEDGQHLATGMVTHASMHCVQMGREEEECT